MHTPDTTAPLAEAAGLLRRLGAAGIDHPGGTLLAHLERVEQRLARWGARPALRLAGLCHAAYGTDGFAAGLLPLGERAALAEVIGEEAEEIVHFYASCDRTASYAGLAREDGVFRDRFTGTDLLPSPARRRDFAELTAANETDLAEAHPGIRTQHGGALLRLFTSWRALLSEPAYRDAREVLTPRGAERLEYLRGLRYGDVVTGVVVKIADFGVTFVELGGVDAMMNIPEVSWRPLDSPADVLREGEERAFTVLSVEIAEDGDGRDRISLSLKDLHPDPMREFARDGLGRTLRGTVTKEVPFGVFVAVADGVEGLLHHDVLGGLRPAVGDGIEVTVTGVNVVNRQVRLAPARPTGS